MIQLPLSEQQKNVLRGYFLGKSYKVIADELCIAECTVAAHIKSIKDPWQCDNRTQMIFCALALGQIEKEWVFDMLKNPFLFPEQVRPFVKQMLLTWITANSNNNQGTA